MFDGPSVLVWGGVSYGGATELYVIGKDPLC